MRIRAPEAGRRAAVLLAAGLGLAGCMVGPDFEAPPAALDAAWSSGSAAVTAPGPVVDTAWWRSLNDPQLNRIVETAAAQNLSLQRAGVRVLQARATLAATVGDYYPQQQQLFGQLLAQRATSDTAGLVGGGSRSATLGRAGITVGWEIDFWGLFRRAIEAADGSLVASIADYDNAMVTLLGDTASTYVNLRTLEARVAIARANIGLQREGLRIASVRYREGATSERDPDQAESQLAETEAQLPALAAQIERARNALAVLLGATPAQVRPMLGPGAIPRPRLMVAAGVPAELVGRRPDLRAALATAAAQSALVGVNRAQLFPAISVSGTFGILSTDAGNIGIGLRGGGWRSSQSYAVGPAVTWSLLNWGQITNQVRAQDAALQQALIGYQQAVLQAQREVEDGLANFVGAQRSAVSLRRAVAAQRRAARVALTQYEQGQTDYTTVITTQRILLQQEDTLVQTEAQIPLGLISIYKALGGGWEIREGRPLVNEANRRQMGLRTDWGPLLDYDDGRLTPPPVRGLLPEPTF